MQLSTNEKRSLRRLQADLMLNKKQLADYVGLSVKTVEYLTKDEAPQEVKLTTYKKIMTAINNNY